MLQRILIPLLLVALIDTYFFQIVRTLTADLSDKNRWVFQGGYWLMSAAVYVLITASILPGLISHSGRYITFSIILISVSSKLFGVLFLFLEDIGRMVEYAYDNFTGQNEGLSGRRDFISKVGLTLFSLPFVTLLYGMMAKVMKMGTKEVELFIPKLPKGWDGAVVAQISDLHVGSLSSTELIDRAAELINEKGADVTVLTGDLVNSIASEANPFVDALSKIQGKLGKFSILGNHDYGIYNEWENDEAKYMNDRHMEQIHADSGFTLLKNANRRLERNGDHISILGSENWGASRHFPKFGNLKQTMAGVPNDDVKILLSHDPTHWDSEVIKDTDIDLTLCGHTHGFQFGMEIPGFVKWSPVQYVYKHWAGLYENAGQYLYVNRGLGFLGYMGRVGMTPEVTFITLRSGTPPAA